MWKRWIIKLAWLYLDELFLRWLAHKSQTQRIRITGLILDFENYLRAKKSKTATLIADLLVNWRE